MNKEKLNKTIKSIYDWPLDPETAWEIYNNIKELASDDCLATIDYLKLVVAFDKPQRMKYRNHLASKGFELRPDELNQYILIVMIVLTETAKVK
jgi:hypothetical protein